MIYNVISQSSLQYISDAFLWIFIVRKQNSFLLAEHISIEQSMSNIQHMNWDQPNKGSNAVTQQINFEFVFQIKIILWTVIEFKDLGEKSSIILL